MDKAWYEDPANVLDLARWRRDQANEKGNTNAACNQVFLLTCMMPDRYCQEWEYYQAFLHPEPEEPTLSERVEKLSQWVRTTPNSFEACYAIDLAIINLLKQMAKRIEDLEAKREPQLWTITREKRERDDG